MPPKHHTPVSLQAQAQADGDWHPAPRQDEWGSKQTPAPGKAASKAAAGVPRQEKYDLEPYDSDDYSETNKDSVPKDTTVGDASLHDP